MRLNLSLPKVEPTEFKYPKKCPQKGCRGMRFIPRVSNRRSHVGRDAPAGELFRPIYYYHSSMEVAMINDVVLKWIVVGT
jgi:hypothetical protein